MRKVLLELKNKALVIGILIVLSFYLCRKLLNLFQLEFRQWFDYLIIIVAIFLIIIGAYHFILKIKIKIVKIPLVIISTILLCVTCPYLILLSALSYNPEHVVIKEDVKLVGYVSAFKRMHVNYYDYKNFIVRGSQVRLYENYGKGGYDPLANSESTIEAESYIWYDDNGKPIK